MEKEKCPYCQSEMEEGFIQSGKIILWTQNKHHFSLKTERKEESIIAKNSLGGTAAPGFCCKSCKRIIIFY